MSNSGIPLPGSQAKDDIAVAGINGYDFVEPTHLSVAAAIASGQGDAGFGISAAGGAQELEVRVTVNRL